MIVNKTKKYRIELTKTKYEKFVKFRSDFFDNLKGSTIFDQQIILVFGAMPDELFSTENEIVPQILPKKHYAHKEIPPLNYEPIFKTYYIN